MRCFRGKWWIESSNGRELLTARRCRCWHAQNALPCQKSAVELAEDCPAHSIDWRLCAALSTVSLYKANSRYLRHLQKRGIIRLLAEKSSVLKGFPCLTNNAKCRAKNAPKRTLVATKLNDAPAVGLRSPAVIIFLSRNAPMTSRDTSPPRIFDIRARVTG